MKIYLAFSFLLYSHFSFGQSQTFRIGAQLNYSKSFSYQNETAIPEVKLLNSAYLTPELHLNYQLNNSLFVETGLLTHFRSTRYIFDDENALKAEGIKYISRHRLKTLQVSFPLYLRYKVISGFFNGYIMGGFVFQGPGLPLTYEARFPTTVGHFYHIDTLYSLRTWMPLVGLEVNRKFKNNHELGLRLIFLKGTHVLHKTSFGYKIYGTMEEDKVTSFVNRGDMLSLGVNYYFGPFRLWKSKNEDAQSL